MNNQPPSVATVATMLVATIVLASILALLLMSYFAPPAYVYSRLIPAGLGHGVSVLNAARISTY